MTSQEMYSVKEMLDRQADEFRRDLEEINRRIDQRFKQNDKEVARELVILGDKVPTRSQFESVVSRLIELEKVQSNTQGRETGFQMKDAKQVARTGLLIAVVSVLVNLLLRYLFRGTPTP